MMPLIEPLKEKKINDVLWCQTLWLQLLFLIILACASMFDVLLFLFWTITFWCIVMAKSYEHTVKPNRRINFSHDSHILFSRQASNENWKVQQFFLERNWRTFETPTDLGMKVESDFLHLTLVAITLISKDKHRTHLTDINRSQHMQLN